MTPRERVLVITFLGASLVIGGWGMFHIFFWKPYSNLNARLQTARNDIDAKNDEIVIEERDIHRAQERDPRLARWEKVSLPDSPSRDADTLQRHVSQERVEYERELSELLKKAGFQNISTAAKPVNSVGVPLQLNKTPLFTRLAYTVEAKATFKAVVDMLEAFHREEKLHLVREFKLRKPQTAAPVVRVPGGPGGPGFPGAPGVPGAPVVPGAPGLPGGQNPQGGREAGLLDVTMTVEALIVTGATTRTAREAAGEKKPATAEKRGRPDSGKPKTAEPIGEFDGEEQEQPAPTPVVTPSVSILAPQRHYDDMLLKNIYTGISRQRQNATPTEDAEMILSTVKLVMLEKTGKADAGWLDPLPEWRIELFDQATHKYFRCSPDVSDEKALDVADRYGSEVLKGTVVDANIHGIVIKVDSCKLKEVQTKLYYKMRLGDFLKEVLLPERDSAGVILDADREPSEKYTRGDWKGPSLVSKQTEEAEGILKAVKLSKSVDSGRRWEVEFNDPVRKRDYTCTPDSSVRNAFEIKDRRGNPVVSGTVVDANAAGVVIKVGELFYKMKLGETFGDALKPASAEGDHAPMKEYERGDWKPPVPEPKDAEEKKDTKDEKKPEAKKDVEK